jgi:pimeloyl-ACP methyl ester carboxylesterase
VTALLVIALLLGGWLYTPDKDRAQLEATYAQAPSEFITAGGLRMHVRQTGPKTAPAIVLLHGFASSLHTWEAWSQTLEKDHRVIRFDLPGAGLTGADPKGDYSDARALQVMTELLDSLQVQQAVVVGHSMGGRLAFKFAAEQPQRVSQLVLIAPEGFGTETAAANSAGPGAAALLPHVLPKALLRSALSGAYANPQALSEATLNRYHDLLLAPQVRRAILARQQQQQSQSQSQTQDPRPWLQQIRAPTWLLWGEKDNVIAPEQAHNFICNIANAELLIVPDAGHLPHEEAAAASLALWLAPRAQERPAAADSRTCPSSPSHSQPQTQRILPTP